jgi:TPR repeat protein
VVWLRKAADQGHATAQYALAVNYAEGAGVKQDYAEALQWYRKAAEGGEAGAAYGVGFSYAKGEGVPQDYPEAVRWYRKAAEAGNAQGQYALGYSYHQGLGVPRDQSEGTRWMRRAADQGDADARSALGYTNWDWSIRRVRYISVLLVFLGGLYFSIDALLPGRSFGDWRQKAKMLFGVTAILWAGLNLWELEFMQYRYTACGRAVTASRELMAGIGIGVFVCLGLTSKKMAKGAG